jgi:hypothetical protein
VCTTGEFIKVGGCTTTGGRTMGLITGERIMGPIIMRGWPADAAPAVNNINPDRIDPSVRRFLLKNMAHLRSKATSISAASGVCQGC